MYTFAEYELSPNLTNLLSNLADSKIVLQHETILRDEEYIMGEDKNNYNFLKCIVCDGEDIKTVKTTISKFEETYNTLGLKQEDLKIWIERLSTIGWDGSNREIEFQYCDNCKSILKIDDISLFLRFDFNTYDYVSVLEKEGYVDENGTPLKCLDCENTDFEIVDIYSGSQGLEEYSLKCKNCGNIVGHWAYGNFTF